MDRRQTGVRVRGQSIAIDFYYEGCRCRETLKLEPTKANLQYAERKRAAVLNEIALGVFDYAKQFPNSRRASTLGKASDKTVSQALDEFLTASKRTCEASTLRDYESAAKHHLKPAFGDFQLRKLTATHIKTWIGQQTISNKRINNVLIPLRAVLKDAFSDGIISQDISARIRNLSHRTEEPNPFPPSEIKLILKQAEPQTRNLFQFAFWTGMRTSELIALEWRDIDFQRGVIKVRRASVRKIVKNPKTQSGEREIKILPLALEALSLQKEFTFEAGSRVFWNPKTGKPWETDGQIRKTAWIPILKAAGVPYRNPYQTRHTYASMLLSAGENPMWVAHQMGHKDWGMIRKRYGRWIPDIDPVAGSKAALYWSQHGHEND
jgi:integrase